MKPLNEFDSVELARVHPENKGKILNANDFGVLFTKFPADLQNIESLENSDTPFKTAIRIFLMTFRGGGRFDFRKGEPDGDINLSSLETLNVNNIVSNEFKQELIDKSNQEYFPYENVTEYEFKLAKGEDIPLRPVTVESGKAFITTTSGCELHNPQIFKVIRGHKFRVGSFYGVNEAKEYAAVISEGGELFVHDAYGVI